MTELHPFLARLAEAGAYQPPASQPGAPELPSNGVVGAPALPPADDPQAAKYAAAALAGEAARLAGTPEGQRNDQANRSAFRMGQLAALGWLSDDAARETLIDAAMDAGLPFAEAERTIVSGLSAGMGAPRSDVELRKLVPAAFTITESALGGGQVFGASHDMESDAEADAEADAGQPSRPRQLIDGGAFIHGRQADVPAIWGEADDVLWAQGEPLILTGPTGVGKTTLGTNIIAGRLGLLPEVLGLPVQPGQKKVLVLAMDRPAQIQRAMSRLLRQYPEDVLDERLIVWNGPPPMDLGQHPRMLFQLVEMVGADTVVIDSLKDAAVKLSDEGTGQGLSRAMNYCVANGVEVLAYHHQKKNSNNPSGKPNTLADVYGSHWITAGAGSVVLLWGNAGDLVIDLIHLKQPAGEVGPLAVGHDHTAGTSFLYDGLSETDKLLGLLSSGPKTAPAVASWLYGDKAGRSGVEKVRRRLNRLAEAGNIVRLDDRPARVGGATVGGKGGGEGVRYSLPSHENASDFGARSAHAAHAAPLTDPVSAGRSAHAPERVTMHVSAHVSDVPLTREDVFPGKSAHGSAHVGARVSAHALAPPKGGERRVRARAREGDPTQLESHEMESRDVEVCARCLRESGRLIPAPGGKRWCETCAYPTENPMKWNDDED